VLRPRVCPSILAAALLTVGFVRPALAASTDIVPRASVLTDDLSSLASAGLVTGRSGRTLMPADFQIGPLWTRGEMAALVAPVLTESARASRAGASTRTALALRDACEQLRPELLLAGVPKDRFPGGKTQEAAILSGYAGVEQRVDRESDKPGTAGTAAVYRVTGAAQLSRDSRLVVSGSNWWRAERRVFANDISPRHFSGLSAAYLNLAGPRGLSAQIGRTTDRWGAGAHGATMLSDNSPPFDEIRVDFPFSLGPHLGRNYHFTQMATAFKERGATRYVEARRITYTFNRLWDVQMEEAFKSSRTDALVGTFIVPFNIQNMDLRKIGLPIRVRDLDPHFNAVVNLGASYSWAGDSRLYGQFFIDDLRNPFGTPFKSVARKVAFLAGYAHGSPDGLNYVVEYSQADPTTYTFRNNEAPWTHRELDWIGLPEGPNNRTLYGRIGARIAPKLTVTVEGRDRRRYNDTYPAPIASFVGATAAYRVTPSQLLTVGYNDYRQDPFGKPFKGPTSTPDIGFPVRIHEWDFSYRLIY
jgi:hypothetical protein